MDSKNDEIIELFEKTGALLKGHFVLRSGLHSGHFFQCAQVCQDMEAVTRMAELTLKKISGIEFSVIKGMLDVLSPLFAKKMAVGVLLVLLTPNKIISDSFISFTRLLSS